MASRKLTAPGLPERGSQALPRQALPVRRVLPWRVPWSLSPLREPAWPELRKTGAQDAGVGVAAAVGATAAGTDASMLRWIEDLPESLARTDDRKKKRQGEEADSQISRELAENIRGLRSEDVIGHAATKSRTESFIARALHKDKKHHQHANDDVQGN